MELDHWVTFLCLVLNRIDELKRKGLPRLSKADQNEFKKLANLHGVILRVIPHMSNLVQWDHKKKRYAEMA